MNKVIHVFDDNVIHIRVDDHVHKMNQLKTVEHIPKYKKNRIINLFLLIDLLDKQNNFYDNDHQVLEYMYQ
jgi:hypothetical protein